MSWSLTFIFLLCLLRVQNMDLTNALPGSSLTGFAIPEVDGSAVGDTCRIFFDATPDTPTGMMTTTAASRKQQVAATTKKPAVQSPAKKPQTKQAGGPIRTQPAAARPITNNNSNPALSLLYYLLTNRRGQIGLYGTASHSAKSSAAWKAASLSSEDSSDES